jgi:asparagine synthetase A
MTVAKMFGRDSAPTYSVFTYAITSLICPASSTSLNGGISWSPFSIHAFRLSSVITIQAEERLQQQTRAHNQTETGRQSLRERVVVEHRIARLVGLGIRKSRYFGRKKTRWQVVMAAVVANVSLVVG